MSQRNYFLAMLTAAGLLSAHHGDALASVVIETVPVGNAGNAADTRYDALGFGAVDHTFQMGKYEVTAGQYTTFLNAVAETDTYGLFDMRMWSDTYGCKIERTGPSGGYIYSVAAEYANRPVNFVTWAAAARFSNWMHNGQPTGSQDLSTTEDGSYYLNGATTDFAFKSVTRKVNATWVIPTEDEWYKSAYHKNDGMTGNYWDYTTETNSVPGRDMSEASNPGNNANHYGSGAPFPIDAPYYTTVAGTFQLSDSPYGTFDQGGNVFEWNETLLESQSSYRIYRGGSFADDYMRALDRGWATPTNVTNYDHGFRVAVVPEPSAIAILGLGSFGMLERKGRRKH